MLTFRFNGAGGKMITESTLTSGMVGQQVKLHFSAEWKQMTKTAVFTAGDVTRDVVDVTDDVITIPAEVLAKPYERLQVGIYGVSSDGRVTPTIYVNGPIIQSGADPSGDPGTDPELPVWAQLQQQINNVLINNPENIPGADLSGYVRTVNGKGPDANGNVDLSIPESSQNVNVDASLTVSGAAADAKAVGDALKEIVAGSIDLDYVIAGLLQKIPVIGVVDDNHHISIYGDLESGEYFLRYENDDGSTTEIGSFTVVSSDPGEPEVPDSPDEPEIPDDPDEPEIPDEPDVPETPVEPDPVFPEATGLAPNFTEWTIAQHNDVSYDLGANSFTTTWTAAVTGANGALQCSIEGLEIGRTVAVEFDIESSTGVTNNIGFNIGKTAGSSNYGSYINTRKEFELTDSTLCFQFKISSSKYTGGYPVTVNVSDFRVYYLDTEEA